MRKAIFIIIPAILLMICAGSANGSGQDKQPSADAVILTLNKPVEREVHASESHYYRFELAAGQYLRGLVTQEGIDVTVLLYGPDGKLIYQADTPTGNYGQEPICLIAEQSGNYRLEIKVLDETALP